MLMQLLTDRYIETAVGHQLDVIGKLVGIDRADIDSGLSDVDYRRYVRAKIWEHKSDGVVEDVIRVLRLVIDDDDAVLTIVPQYPAGFVVQVNDEPVTDTVADLAAEFLRGSAGAGIRAIFESSTDVASETFAFASAFGAMSDERFATNTTIEIDQGIVPAGFPPTGSLVVDGGLADEETVTYTIFDTNTFTVSALANYHPQGASVTLVDPATGDGFGDEAVGSTGGKLASAIEGD
jgi:hypothetical protein